MAANLREQLKEMYRSLVDENVMRLVLVGEPGVGKTGMARKLSDRANKAGKFDLTLWVSLNRVYDDDALCESIARQLSLLTFFEEWEDENESRELSKDEAGIGHKQDLEAKIYDAIKGKKFLLILDDEGNRMTESDIMPRLKYLLHLDRQASYKLLITRANNRDGPILEGSIKQIHPLAEDKLLSSLMETLKKVVNELPGIEGLAKNFIKKIRFPSDVFILSKAFSYFGQNESGVQKLQSALDVQNFDAIQLLTSGYELLPNWVLMDLCYTDDHFLKKRGSVHYSELICYWIMEGYLGHFDCIEKAYEKGHSVLMELIRCGLLNPQEAGYVSMSAAKHHLDDIDGYCKFVSTTHLGLAGVYEGEFGRTFKAERMIRASSNVKGHKRLSTLMLDANHLNSKVPSDFFQFQKELEVLVIFNPGGQLFPLPLFDMQNLGLLLLRGCDALEAIEHIPESESDTEISHSNSTPTSKSDTEISHPNSTHTSKNDTEISHPNSTHTSKSDTEISHPNSTHTSNVILMTTPQSSSHLQKLTVLEISGPSLLDSIPDKLFHHMPQLRSINLSYLKIESLPSSFYDLEELIWLILRGCDQLEELGSLKNFQKLQILDLSGANSFKYFYDYSLKSNRQLRILNLSGSQISSLPLIKDLQNLTHLLLSDCGRLRRLRKITRLSSLQFLDLSGATKFKDFIDPSFERLPSFKVFNISRTAIVKLPPFVGNLHSLYVSDCPLLKVLHCKESIKNLHVLDLSGSHLLKEIKEGFFHDLSCLRVLNLSKTNIKSLPSLSNLHNLRHFLLSHCFSLETLNDFSSAMNLEILDLSGCKALKEIKHTSFEKMEHLQKLDLSGTNITHLPTLPTQSNLRYLLLNNCSKLEVFPSLEHLSRLEELNMFRVGCLGTFGVDFLEHLVDLRTLDLSESQLKSLPSLLNLKSLKFLSVRDCQNLSELPGLEALTTLEVLDLSGTAVKDLPSFKNFGNLQCLLLENCLSLVKFKNLEVLVPEGASRRLPHDISELTHLQQLALPNFEIPRIGTENSESLKQSQWSISNWPDESTITVKDFQILQILKENPTLWETRFNQFHFFVYPTGEKSILGDKNSYIKELCLRDKYLQTRQISHGRKQERSLEIRGFHHLPSRLEIILAHSEFVFLIDNEFLGCLSDLGADSIKKMKACWIEKCSIMTYVLPADSESKMMLEKDDGVISEIGENLETLLVFDAVNLESICEGDLQSSSLKNLKCLSLESCPEILNVCPSSQPLEKLEILQIKVCDGLRVLFEHETEVGLKKLHTLRLWALPKLIAIPCNFPSLQNLMVGECPLLVNLASSNQLSKSLRNLQINFCDNLETVFQDCNETLPSFQTLCLWDLPKLENIGAFMPPLQRSIIRGCPKLLRSPSMQDKVLNLSEANCK